MSNKKMQKALCKLNGYIDDDRQMLCDRIKRLEKSHKRMLDVIKACRYCVANCRELPDFELYLFVDVLDKEIERKVL